MRIIDLSTLKFPFHAELSRFPSCPLHIELYYTIYEKRASEFVFQFPNQTKGYRKMPKI